MNEGEIELGVDTLVVKGDPTKLFEELAKAQNEFIPIPKGDDGQIGTKRFKYAGYATIIKCVRPALTAHGISIIQPLHSRDGKAVTTTILAGHGASVACSFYFNADFLKRTREGEIIGDDPQEFGRCHTYYRRYQLQSILGIEADEDADSVPLQRDSAQYVDTKPPSSPSNEQPKQTTAVAAASKSPPPADPKAASTVTMVEPGKVQLGAKRLNELLTEGMKQLKWSMDDVKSFYKEHVDPKGFTKPDNMTIEQKRTLHAKMVEVKGVAPF